MNEIIILDKIEKKLREKRDVEVFPLTPTHRNELRKLRDTNIGNLKNRLRIIKKLKEEEYVKKYEKEIQQELKKQEKKVMKINEDWKKRVEQIKKIIIERKKLEEKIDVGRYILQEDYDEISRLETKEWKRNFDLNINNVAKEISEEEFEEKYGKNFKIVSEKIDDIYTKYEESINFGDLEIVKELYYIMKSADGLFTKIEKLQV